MEALDVPTPSIDWEVTNLPDVHGHFKEHANLMFSARHH